MQWNRADFYLEYLLRFLLMGAPEIEFLISTWGNETRATIASKIIQNGETDVGFRDFCMDTLSDFNVCRENRNLIVHGSIEDISDDSFSILRLTKNIEKRLVYRITIEHLEEVERDLIILCSHLDWIIANSHPVRDLMMRSAPTLRERPQRPRNLTKILQPVLKDGPLPPQSSLA